MIQDYTTFNSATFKRFPVGSTLLALLAVLIMFGMLPFTQFLAGLKKPDMEVRKFEITVPPPQFTPPEPPPPEPPPEQEAPPEMDPPPPQLSLSQLNMALNPGVGGALAADFGLGEVGVNAEETMEQISMFEISDLDAPPRKIRQGRIIWTPKMKREKVPGSVHFEGVIKEDGTVQYMRTIEASSSDYESLFIKFMNTFVYSPPTVAGKPVQARLIFKVPIAWQ